MDNNVLSILKEISTPKYHPKRVNKSHFEACIYCNSIRENSCQKDCISVKARTILEGAESANRKKRKTYSKKETTRPSRPFFTEHPHFISNAIQQFLRIRDNANPLASCLKCRNQLRMPANEDHWKSNRCKMGRKALANKLTTQEAEQHRKASCLLCQKAVRSAAIHLHRDSPACLKAQITNAIFSILSDIAKPPHSADHYTDYQNDIEAAFRGIPPLIMSTKTFSSNVELLFD